MSNNNNSRDEWDATAEVTRRPVCAPAERDEHTALRDAVAAERAAVVAWLRAQRGAGGSALVPSISKKLANSIERGAHRRKEGK